MEKKFFSVENDGFYGVWYPNPAGSKKGMIITLGDSAEDLMAVTGAKWIHKQGCHALAMAPAKNDYGHHNYPLERFVKAIDFMKTQGCEKIGVAGASTTGMLALIAASYFPEITLTIAMTPADFVMEGFYRDGKDGAEERPGDGESSVSWQGQQLPYLPYAYRHPEYWRKIKEESKAGGDMIASRKMFEESERRHPVQEEEKIKVERIKGKILFIGAEDDVLWDTCKYIRRMTDRLASLPHECSYEALIYRHGTHFVFPESMLKMALPAGEKLLFGAIFRAARKYPNECAETRRDIDRNMKQAIEKW